MADFSLVGSHLTKQESGVCGHSHLVQLEWAITVHSMDWEIPCQRL
ncbi:TPA: hypothetical protein U2B98_001575 [Streptococcus suis]|nr:hypothetical protein [Streptococcus suis]NQK45285.1 hypothetical protein [Streptococcus suis]HEM6082896.1 hypothetical protein [Streptococcus suis]HEM6112608.1 hypothetical protein [Streptococcus suis]HEM6266848.1 hypothetical protein [Streptococcus suis]